MQYVACHQGTTAMTAELAQGERRAAAQIMRHVEIRRGSPDRRGIRRPRGAPIRKVAPAGTGIGVQNSIGRPSRSACIGAPVRQMMASVLNFSVGPDMVISSAAASSGLPTARFAQAKRQTVHRSRGRHAHVPIFEPPGIVLDGRLRAAAENFERSRRVGKRLEHARGHAADAQIASVAASCLT